MTHLASFWLDLSILLPLVGGICLLRLSDAFYARRWAIVISGITLLGLVITWGSHLNGGSPSGMAMGYSLTGAATGRELFRVDALNAPLLPAIALLHFLTTFTTVRTKIRRFSFGWTLIAESLSLATLAAADARTTIACAILATIPPYFELRVRGRPTGAYVAHMLAFAVTLLWGWSVVEWEGGGRVHTLYAVVPLLAAVLIRTGIAPWHCWATELFEHATFGTALLFVAPIAGACLAVRLVLPVAPDWVIRGMGLLSLATAVYASGLSLIQGEARRFFCYLFLSHSAMVLVGLEMKTDIGLCGGLCVWLSVIVSLGGFGLVLRAIEARRGRIILGEHLGLYDHTPALALCFMVTGLGSVGFPGTLGFIGTELLVDGAVTVYPYVGAAIVVAAAMNGIAVVRAYLLLFAGPRHSSTVSLALGARERIAILSVLAIVVFPGLLPHRTVASRYRAAEDLLRLADSESHPRATSPSSGGNAGVSEADSHHSEH